ncbi:MAG: EamA family transporter [Candidatus Riflebacteria bacterium]|nr:EamA family transporter [Candidatus Riflebacteria bacterium]
MTNRKAFGLLVIMNVIWGGSYAVSKWVLTYVTPAFLSMTRFLLGGFLLLFLAEKNYLSSSKETLSSLISSEQNPQQSLIKRIFNQIRISKRNFIELALVYGLGISVGFIVHYHGVRLTTSLKASVEMTLEPVFMILLAIIFLGEPVKKRTLLGLFVSFTGTLLLVFDGKDYNQIINELSTGGQTLGDFLVILSLLLGSAYCVMNKPLAKKIGPFKSTAWGCIIASVLIMPIVLYETYNGAQIQINIGVILAILFLGVLCTAVGYGLWNKILMKMPASDMAITINIQPVAGVLAGLVFMGESLGIVGVIGAFTTLFGIWIVPISPFDKE